MQMAWGLCPSVWMLFFYLSNSKGIQIAQSVGENLSYLD